MGAVGCSGSDGLSDVSGSFGAVGVSAGAVVSDSAGSVGSSGSVGLSGSSGIFLCSEETFSIVFDREKEAVIQLYELSITNKKTRFRN